VRARSPAISVRNAQRVLPVDLDGVRAFAECAGPLALGEECTESNDLRTLNSVAIILVSDRRIAALHRKFMQVSGPTDVITFQHGEIFISVETAARQARKFGTSLSDELKLYLVHGLLHLAGYNDSCASERRAMERVQKRIVRAAERNAQAAAPV